MNESVYSNHWAQGDATLQMVIFTSGGIEFGADITHIQEIHEMVAIARGGQTHTYIEGMINLLGQPVPVIDLRLRLGIGKRTHHKSSRIIVAEVRSTLVGFIVDCVSEVLSIRTRDTMPPVPGRGEIGVEFVAALAEVNNRLITVLDLEKVLQPI